MILWLHKGFLTRLWPVAVASGQGKVSRIPTFWSKCFEIIDFITPQEQPLFDSTCRNALRQNFVAKSVTVLSLPNCTRLSIQLLGHACTIDMLEQAEGGKQRTLRLCYSEALAGASKQKRHGKFLRVWFLTQTLAQYQKKKGFNNPNIHCNEQTGQVLFEFTHLPTKKDLQQMFVDVLSVLQILINMDIDLGSTNLDGSQTQWNMAAIKERLNNPAFSATNQFALEHIYWYFAYQEGKSLITRCTHDKTLRHLVEAAQIFSDASISTIEGLLENQCETDRQTLLWHLLLTDPYKAVPLVERYFDWLVNETMAMRLVSQNGKIFKYLASEICQQRAIVFAAIKSDPETIVHAPKYFRNDFEIMNYALAHATNYVGGVIELIGEELSSNHQLFRQLLITAVNNSSSALSCNAITHYLEKNPEFYKELLLLALESKDDDSYKLSHQIYRRNLLEDHHLYRELALKVLAQDDEYPQLKHFQDLNNDREIVYTAIRSHSLALSYAGHEFRADKEIVKEAVRKMGRVLRFASIELRDDEEIVLAAVRNDGSALEYASGRLRASPQIVTAAVDNTGRALKYANEHFKRHPDYLRLAVNHHPIFNAYHDLDEVQRGNKELLTIAVLKDPGNFEVANQELSDDEELAQLAVRDHGAMLEHASSRLQGQKRIVELAVQNKGTALEYASPEMQACEDVVKVAVQNSGMALRFANDRLKNSPEVVKLALQQNPLALEFAGDTCRNDPELVNIAVQSDGNALRYVGRALQNDPQIIAAAINSVGAVAVKHIQQLVARESSSDR